MPRALAYLERMPAVGVVGCRTLNADGTPQPTVDRFHSVRGLVAEAWRGDAARAGHAARHRARDERPRRLGLRLVPARPAGRARGRRRLRRGLRDVRRGPRPLSSPARRRVGRRRTAPRRRSCITAIAAARSATGPSATSPCCRARCASFVAGAAGCAELGFRVAAGTSFAVEGRRRGAGGGGAAVASDGAARPALCRAWRGSVSPAIRPAGAPIGRGCGSGTLLG